MDQKDAEMLGNRMQMLLKSSDGGYTRDAGPICPREAESRHDWDALLYTFYTRKPKVLTSETVL